MLDIKAIRDNANTIQERLATRGGDAHNLIPELLSCDEARRHAETQKQTLQSERKQLSKQIGALMSQGKADEAEAIKQEVHTIGEKITTLDQDSETNESRMTELLMSIPNIPHTDCPVGACEEANPEVRTWGEKASRTALELQVLASLSIGVKVLV